MNYKVKVNNPAHSEAVQKVFFELGYRWIGSMWIACSNNTMQINKPYLYFNKNSAEIKFGNNTSKFEESGHKLLNLDHLDPQLQHDCKSELLERIATLEERLNEICPIKPEPEQIEAGMVFVQNDSQKAFIVVRVRSIKYLFSLLNGNVWNHDSLFGGVGRKGFTFAANSVEEYYNAK